MATKTSSHNIFGIATPHMTLDDWIAEHEKAHHYFCGPRDTRIPGYLPRLTQAVCTLRFSISQLRMAFGQHPEGSQCFRKEMLLERRGLHGSDQAGHLLRLFDDYLSRIDWREQDVLEMILEFLTLNPVTHGADLAEELARFRALRDHDRHAYDQAILGLISEARGNLMGLAHARHSLRNHPVSFAVLEENAIRLLIDRLSRSLGLDEPVPGTSEPLPEDPAFCWQMLYGKAGDHWQEQDTILPLKPFEKASLYLLEALPVDRIGHSGFVQYLIEHEGAYRRLLAACYAPVSVRIERLTKEMERYNRLPENATRRLHYREEEKLCFLYALLLRPDVIAAIAERERHKDIYRVISGLGSKAHLPRVLQEVQNVFGYVTPESFEKIVEMLRLDPSEIIRVIASYKQYSADPGGDIIIYVCKGTACFLRGQPELSRRLALEIQAGEGKVGADGIQFIEMDCFGVCHLAPVIKARDVFLGKRTAADIPRVLQQLLQGPRYDNRLDFLLRIRQLLAPGHESDPLGDLCLSAVIDETDPENSPHPPLSTQHSILSTQHSALSTSIAGSCLKIDHSGQVFALSNGGQKILGRLLPHTLPFTYGAPDGSEQVGCLVLDEVRQIRALVHYPASFLENELQQTLKPQAFLSDGGVWVEQKDGSVRLGTYTANALAVETEPGNYRLVLMAGPPNQEPPGRTEDLAADSYQVEDETFVKQQDRLVLGFAEHTDPEDIESYIACGGYLGVRRALGLTGEPAWGPEDIVKELARARLRGRGGAGFPAGRKWDAVRLAQCVFAEGDENREKIKLIVANGDEGDPGAFMDRTLIQERPHQVIEGMILAALTVGARYGVIYVRKEYEDAVRRLEHALFQARRRHLLGENICGIPGQDFDIDIRLGAGAFVAGEKRAIMRAIEGEPAEPTLNAVSNTYRGLWGKPTLLNNVETFANVPLIMQRGGAWYAQQGTELSGGSKIFSVAGIVKKTGLVEVRFGRTLNDILRICGGVQERKQLAGVQIGGPSGAILSLTGVRSYLLFTPLDFDAFDQVGAMLGSGGLVFIGEDDDVVRLARHFTDWLSEESCGQCPSCFNGTVSLGRTLDLILQGDANSNHIHALWAKSDALKAGSRCGLGMTAANPVTSALRFFPHVFLHHLLANPRLNRIECFRILEALRFLTRESVEKISRRQRIKIGYSFTLKKHLLRHLLFELERMDQYHPPERQQAQRFLDLLQISAYEAGMRDLNLECSFDELKELRLSHEPQLGLVNPQVGLEQTEVS